jgi:hypothetical protein
MSVSEVLERLIEQFRCVPVFDTVLNGQGHRAVCLKSVDLYAVLILFFFEILPARFISIDLMSEGVSRALVSYLWLRLNVCCQKLVTVQSCCRSRKSRSRHERDEKWTHNFTERPLGICEWRWKGIIKAVEKEMRYGDVGCIRLLRDDDQWQALVYES